MDGFEGSSFVISWTLVDSVALSMSTSAVDSASVGADVFVMRTEADLGHFIPRGFDCFSNELTIKQKIYSTDEVLFHEFQLTIRIWEFNSFAT